MRGTSLEDRPGKGGTKSSRLGVNVGEDAK